MDVKLISQNFGVAGKESAKAPLVVMYGVVHCYGVEK
jgi:hypothetical protein